MPFTVKQITIYPLKSARGVDQAEALVTPRGLENDRLYMVVDENGNRVTQREQPKLAILSARADEAGLDLCQPDGGRLRVTLAQSFNRRTNITLWSSKLEADLADDPVNLWLSDYLGAKARLVHLPDDVTRTIDPTFSQPGDETSLADEFPILVATQDSLDGLAPHFTAAVTMDRFRPNIVLEGAEPFAEDLWLRIRIGSAEFELVKPCARCVVTTVDQDSSMKPSKEPLKTLGQLRRGEGGVYFGENAIPRKTGIVRVGDTVEILETKPLSDLLKNTKINGLRPSL